jgi:hypothetical protein
MLTLLKTIITNKLARLISFTATLTVVLIYYLSVAWTSGWANYLNTYSTPFVSLQIFFSILVALLAGYLAGLLAIAINQRVPRTSSASSLFMLVFSLGTSGCYACSTLLLPLAGLSATVFTLPFGGLEIKILTAIFLLIIISDTHHKLLTGCDLHSNFLQELGRQIGLIVIFLTIIFSLPVFVRSFFPSLTLAHDYQCQDHPSQIGFDE